MQGTIKEGNFYFPKHVISIFPSSVQTIVKFEHFGKIMLYVISQG